jgi:hypothetical protein
VPVSPYRKPSLSPIVSSTLPDNSDPRVADTARPICYFCSSLDTMTPFHRDERVWLLSGLIPRLRWRYCRTCTRHFLTVRGKSSGAVSPQR